MFDTMRPLLPIPNNPPPMVKPGLLGTAPPSFTPMALPDEPQIPESAWERGLRTAKEVKYPPYQAEVEKMIVQLIALIFFADHQTICETERNGYRF